MARRRRPFRMLLLAAAVAALLLFLRGEGKPDPDAAPLPAEASAPTPGGSGDEPQRPAPAAESIDPGVADRLSGVLRRFDQALAQDRLAAAQLALAEADRLRLGADQQPRRSAAREQLAAARVAIGERLAADLRAGRMFEARQRLARIRSPADPQVDTLLADLAAARGWPRLGPDVPVPASGSARPGAEPGRAVRVWLGDRVAGGSVQQVRDGRFALRVQADGRVTFPTVDRAQLELAEPTLAEALAEAEAAAAAGDRLGRDLWLAHLIERGHGADPRVAALRRQ